MKQLNRSLFLFIFLFCSFLLKAQFDSEKYDKESFLIGTLDEYMGYQRTFTNGDGFYYQRVDIMTQNDLKYALFIDSLFSLNYSDITIVNNGTAKGIKMYSPTLSLKIDDYYNYEPQLHWTSQGDTIYSGSLKKERFETEKQKLSFLLGAYLRYGMCETKAGEPSKEKITIKEKAPNSPYIHLIDGIVPEKADEKCTKYCLFMPNAPWKAEMSAELLRELDCEDVEHVFYEDFIPASHFAIFKPTQKVQEIIDDAENLRKYISEINTDGIKFTLEGAKFIWVEPDTPCFTKEMKTLPITSGLASGGV